MSPEQMRKKDAARTESLRHARYSQADGERSQPRQEPEASKAIEAAGRRVNAATRKEEETIGRPDPRPNDERY
jgi:hypothetical protein